MREIKFRAWDKQNKQMLLWVGSYDVGLFGIFADNHILINHIIDCEDHQELDQSPFHIDNYELMQYTGLKDKNGKKIYEGDIIKWCVWDHKVEWEKHSASYGAYALSDIIDIYSMKLDPHNWMDAEVIGNIYENPELLK